MDEDVNVIETIIERAVVVENPQINIVENQGNPDTSNVIIDEQTVVIEKEVPITTVIAVAEQGPPGQNGFLIVESEDKSKSRVVKRLVFNDKSETIQFDKDAAYINKSPSESEFQIGPDGERYYYDFLSKTWISITAHSCFFGWDYPCASDGLHLKTAGLVHSNLMGYQVESKCFIMSVIVKVRGNGTGILILGIKKNESLIKELRISFNSESYKKF